MKIHNFSAGPCILPQEVLSKAAESVVQFNDTGLSLIEMSHRSAPFVAVMERARSLVKSLLNVPDDYEVLFLQGGASLGFYISTINLLKKGGKACYINTGTWSTKAIKEAQLLGDIIEVASSKDKNFSYIPSDFEIPADCDYLHYTSNNTIVGTQFHHVPKTDIPVICDMSSDIFSKEIDVSQFALIYAGAQKNMGPAGTTLYIVKKSLLGQTGRDIPSMLNLEVHISKDSMFNTPPVFPIYVSMLTLEWLEKLGGVHAIEKINDQKAEIFYAEVDSNANFRGLANKSDRSKMNPTFELTDPSKKEAWDKLWQAAGISGIHGHRSVGGYRASMYNALPLESVQVLVDTMKKL